MSNRIQTVGVREGLHCIGVVSHYLMHNTIGFMRLLNYLLKNMIGQYRRGANFASLERSEHLYE